MEVYKNSEARKRLVEVQNIARTEEVIIQKRDGQSFSVVLKKTPNSPFDVWGVKTRVTTKDIRDAIKDSRSRT